MAGVLCLFSVLISTTWIGAIDSEPLNHTQSCQVDTDDVYFKYFEFQKFSGLWHTTWRSRSHVEEEHPQTESRHFYLKEDGNVSVVHTKRTGRGGCSMYETTLLVLGNARYVHNSGERFTMTIVETDYHSASLLMYCTNDFEDGVCAEEDQYFEIISRDIQMVPDIEMTLLLKVDELCSSLEDMVYFGADCQDGSIVIDSIPVLPRFDLHTKNGLSFALAQSNFTTAYSLTGYNIHLSNIDRMIGWFTQETSDGVCTPVMSTMMKQIGKSGANVYNRLGGLASRYSWHQWKVLYSDTNYTLAYICYADHNGTCPHQAEEVRLDGRLKDIDPIFQKKLYVLLQKVCMSPQNMQNLVHNVDCANVLLDTISLITEEFENLKYNKCTFENLVTARYDWKVHKMDGIWYNVAAVNSEPGEVLHIRHHQGVGLEILTCESIDNKCEWNSGMRLVQLCDYKADFIKHVMRANMTATPTYLMRMAYIDEMTFFTYECHSEHQGLCDAGHLVFKVYSRVANLTKNVLEELEEFIPFFCLNISDLQTAVSFPAADSSIANQTNFPAFSECAVENITQASNFNQTKILGYWYEIARSGLEENTFQNLVSSPHSGVVYFAQNDLGHLTFNYFGAIEDNCVSNIFSGKTRPHCEEQFDGNYIARLCGTSWAFFKILYTDHDNLVIMYACAYLYPDGQCAFPLLHVLGKQPKFTEELKAIMDESLEKSCVHSVSWTISDYKKNCTDFFISDQHRNGHSQETSNHYSVQNDGYQLTSLQLDKRE